MFDLKPCPLCGKEPYKIIYYGMPTYFCKNEDCNCLYGFWSFIYDRLPFNGMLYIYDDRYLKALYRWLFGIEGKD